MTKLLPEFQSVHLMNVEQYQMAADPQSKPAKSADRLLSSTIFLE